MKKCCFSLFFLVLFSPVCMYAGNSAMEKPESICVQSGFHMITPEPGGELSQPSSENVGIPAFHLIANQLRVQNIHSFHHNSGYFVAQQAPGLLTIFLSSGGMHGNHRLSCNYPSHNFW